MALTASQSDLRDIMRARAVRSGHDVATRRIAKGWGPTFFAGLLGVPLQTLHKIEHGQIIPRDQLKAAIALALGVELDELYPWPSIQDLVTALPRAAA